MGQAFFYHLIDRPVEATLPVLVEKSLAAGWRVAVLGDDAALLDRLDAALWQGDGFLPHGRSGGKFDADQPVLLTDADPANNPDCVMTIDGRDLTPDDVNRYTRCCILFNGADEELLERARAQWRAMSQAGIEAQYWSDEGGRWSKKAENSAKA